MTKTTFTPTGEQQEALRLFATGRSLAIEAGAGTGKTATLKLLGESTPRRGQYIAFNKAIVEEAKLKMPSTVAAATAHSLAYRNTVARNPWMADRLRHSARMKSTEIAARLKIDRYDVALQDGALRRLHSSYLAGLTMRAVIRFCQTADLEPDAHHVPYIDGIDVPPGARHNNRLVAKALVGPMRRAWADITDPNGSLPFRHDHYLKCQPPETLVRKTDGTSIAIDKIKVGDRVMTWNGDRRLGHIRRTGRAVTHVGYRRFEGGLVRVATASGRTSRYTPDHICIAMLGEPTEGNHIVYLMQRGQSFRIGRTPWRMSSQDNRLGPVHRALSQGASAVWILSAHATDYDAALAEALAQHRYGIPGWQFRSGNEFMPLAEFWSEAGDLAPEAKMCLEAHGRDIRYPLWQNDGRHYQRRPIEIRACNLMSGMRVCEVDLARPDSKGQIVTGGWTGAWQPATVTREPYDGMVYSIEVGREHTYIADGIVTHNCWHLDGPKINADYILFDECQPPDTLVALAGGGEKRIADVEAGDRVVSYTKGRILSEKLGSTVLGKSERHHQGQLITVQTETSRSSYTPNHICMAVINPALEDRFMLYLMRKDDRYRIGVTKARHGSGPGRTTGIHGRLREEGGDAAWILATFESRLEAEAAEGVASLTWRIPQARFGATKFWESWDTTLADHEGCAGHYGRDLRYPLIGTEHRRMLGDRFTEIRAANLMDGMLVMGRDGQFAPIRVTTSEYDGPVISLSVSGPATYVADGIVTHNCQDANPVLVDICKQQTHAQLVWVGDSNQQIYGFTGAINALATVGADHTAMLSQSFRFGPAIADIANRCLEGLHAPLRLTGLDTIPSEIRELDGDARSVFLSRTNAAAVRELLATIRAGRKGHLVGGGREVVDFAKAARDLMEQDFTAHPELACFASWAEVQTYVEQDEQGGDLSLLVSLIDDFGVQTILDALERMPREEDADVILSTAHKSKGREWDSVKLADDFPAAPRDEELRLLYVACTRAKLHLDISAIDYLTGTGTYGVSADDLVAAGVEGGEKRWETSTADFNDDVPTVRFGDEAARDLSAERSMTEPEAAEALLRTLTPPVKDDRREMRLEVLRDLLTLTDAGIELDSDALRELIEEVEAATEPVDEAGPMQGHHARAALEQIQARAALPDSGREPQAEAGEFASLGLDARPTAETHRPAPDTPTSEEG